MILGEQNIYFLPWLFILLGLLIAIGVFVYVAVSGFLLVMFRRKSDEIKKKYINGKFDKIMSDMLKVSFMLEVISGIMILLLL